MKRSDFFKVLIVAILIPLYSCGTIYCGSKQKVTFEANVEEANYLTVDGRKYRDVTFPFKAKVRRGYYDSVVTTQAEGYDKLTLNIKKQFNGVTLLNFLCGGIIGFGLDAATGAMTKPQYKWYELELVPVSEQE